MSNKTSKYLVFVLNSIADMITGAWVNYKGVGGPESPHKGCKHKKMKKMFPLSHTVGGPTT
jgi:hypothetical protein